MEATLVPIFICVILPIVIVWLVVRARKHEMDKKTEIMLKAIENGAQIDPQLFKTKQSTRSIKQELMDKFTGACVTSFMGIAFLVIGLLNRSNPGMFKGLWFLETALSAGAILLAIGLAVGVLATAIAFLYPVDAASAGQGLWDSIGLFLATWKQYLLLPVAILAIAFGLVLSKGSRSAVRL